MATDPARFPILYRAFEADGFTVTKRAYTESGSMGLAAEHKTAKNYDTGNKKTSYYVEGTPYERGYLLGLLAEPSVSDMTNGFAENIIFDFIGLDFLNNFPLLKRLLVKLLEEMSMRTWHSLPAHVHEEARGIYDGCKKSNPKTRVTLSRIVILNIGFDIICALAYTGMLKERAPQLETGDIRLAMLCNVFSVFGQAAGGTHYFARDFMFASGGSLQNNIAHIIHRPHSDGHDEALQPYVSIAAPGMIGSISAMNTARVAGGINMSPAANCDTDNIGMNSLLLLRECIMRGTSAADAVNIIQSAERGVAWNYVLSDGANDAACTVEAGASMQHVDFLSYPAKQLLPHLPDAEYLKSHSDVPLVNGTMVRWCNAPFPDAYLEFNSGLWQHYKAFSKRDINLYPDAFSPDGYINRTRLEQNCPSSFYFAPQRAQQDVHITTNHFLLPRMRLCAMEPWCTRLVKSNVNDIQWRYDELNHELRQAVKQGGVSYSQARRLAEFLAPYGRHPDYYARNPRSRDGKALRIQGCTSLFDLKQGSVESHYGYYADEWVKTTLPAYIDA